MAKTVSWNLKYDTSGTTRGAQDAERSLTGLEGAVNRVGGGLGTLQGRGSSTFSYFGSAVAGLDMNPLIGGISSVGGVVDRLGGQLKTARSEGEGLNKSLLMAGAGAALTALGGALEHLAGPLEKAKADTEAAFTGANADIADFQGEIDSLVTHMERYGHTADDTNEAVAKMTVATKDPRQALDEMNFVLTVATYKHESLSEAAGQVAKAHAGTFRAFKDFGINTTDMSKAVDEAAASEKKLAEENTKLQNAQQSLADFEARLVESRKASIDQWAEKVATANQRVQDADQNLADVEARLTEASNARQQAAVDAANAAREAQMSAEERLADLKERLADRNKPSIQQQYALQKAHTEVDKAQRDLVAGTGAYTDRVQKLADAEDRLNQLQAERTASMQQSVSERQELRHAEEAVAAAKEKTAGSDDKVRAASVQTRSETVELRKALEAQTKAHDDLADTEVKAAKAGELTLSQQQEERKLRDNVAEASKKQADAAVDNSIKQAAAAEVGVVFAKLQEEVMQRFGTAADERADTFAGKVDMVKAKIADGAAVFGEKWAPTIMGVGIGLMGLSALTSLASGVIGFFGGTAAVASVGVDTLAVSEVVATGTTTALDGSLLGLVGSIGLILLPIALLAGAAYLIYENWDSIASWFADRWDNVKNIFTDAKDWVGDNVVEIVGFVTGIPGQLAGFVGDMNTAGWNLIVGLWNGAVGAVTDVLSGFGQLIYDNTIGAAMDWLGIGSPSLEAHKIGMFFGQGLANGIAGSGDLVVGAVDEVNSRLLGRQLATINVAATQATSSISAATGGGPGDGGPGAAGGTVEYHTHLHLERDSIHVDNVLGQVDDVVDQIHEGLQRKLRRTGDLELAPT